MGMDPKQLRRIFAAETRPDDGGKRLNHSQKRRRRKRRLEKASPGDGAKASAPLHFLQGRRNAFMKRGDSRRREVGKAGSAESRTAAAAKSKGADSARHLKGSQFRFLNELLYTQTSAEAAHMFASEPAAFRIYHAGFEAQRERWPRDPLQRVVKLVRLLPARAVVADFGCGDARLAAAVPDKTVHSFDFVAVNERVTACDMRRTPLDGRSCDMAVFCLSLMGTNCNEFVREANRVLKAKGALQIVEIASRIERLTRLVRQIEKMGFECIDKKPVDFFIYLTFIKRAACPRGELPLIVLKPCAYKKR